MCHLLIGRQKRPTLLQPAFSSLCSLGSCKTTCDSLPPSVSAPLSTDTKHSTVMYVCGGIFPLHLGTECSHSVYFFVFYVLAASSNCPSVFFLCTQGYPHFLLSSHARLLTHTHTQFHNVPKNTSVTAHSIILPASTVIKL